MHFSLKKILVLLFLYSNILYAKPTIYFILSNDCPHCHNLMSDINQNNSLVNLLSNEYNTIIIDTKKQSVPSHLSFDGNVPAIIITNENKIIGDLLYGNIPSNELDRYFTEVKQYLNKTQKEYYVY